MSKPGNGSGSVTSSPAGISCGSTCSADYAFGTSVTLTATPAAGSDFTGWNGGGCSGTSTCTVTMNQAGSVEANFVLQKRTLSATKTGSGSGSLTSDPSGLDCGSTCSKDFDFGTSVTITANPAAGSDFVEWGPGACESSGTSTTCTVAMSENRSIEGKFALEKRTLSVTKSGTGSGAVTSEPAGVDCGSTCSAGYDYGTSVTLTASAGPNSDFGGWSGACSGSSTTCTVTMDEARNVEAGFGLQKRALSVTKDGGGSGSVTSSPGGIDCGATCSADYDHGTTVTLSATPAANSDFSGWDGACEGLSTCTVEMDQARSVKATFAPEQRALSVTKSGTGSGTVTSSPGTIDCGAVCSNEYDYGTSVTLTANPAAGSRFGDWGGACSGSSTTCTVTMDEARSVGAAFTDIPPQTTITAGPSGTVRSTSASFGFSSSESGSSFQCRRDGGPWVSCTSPKAYSSLSQGSHSFEVAATDGAGNRDATPAKRTWKVDTVAPRVTSVTPSSGATGVSPTRNVLATFSERMRPETINTTTVTLLRKGTTTKVRALVTYNPTLRRATLDPNANLRPGATYIATVRMGTRDLAGNPRAVAKRWSFTVRR